jgi:NAD(P)-dependent dehydrogenase (short-subunit alcohol dehydrogenase family)
MISFKSSSPLLPSHDSPGLHVLAALGGMVVARFAYRILKYSRRHFVPEMPTIRRPTDFLETRYGSGSWALVVGMNQMGCALAHQFALQNFSLVLVDGDRKRLVKHLQRFQKENPSIITKSITVDFGLAATEGWVDIILKELDNMSISVLVNAAAVSDSFASPSSTETPLSLTDPNQVDSSSLSTDIDSTRKLLVTQIFPTVLLTERIVPRLIERFDKLQLRGAVITVNDTYLSPLNITVQSTWFRFAILQSMKQFTCLFSRMVRVEAKGAVDFLTINPGPNLSYDAKGMFAITPQECAAASIQQLRYGVQETSGWWIHDLHLWIVQNMPSRMLRYA